MLPAQRRSVICDNTALVLSSCREDRGFMLFHTTHFLYFFCVVFAAYWLLPWHRLRMFLLVAASCFFYMCWNPYLITLILFSAGLDFVIALKLESLSSPSWR